MVEDALVATPIADDAPPDALLRWRFRIRGVVHLAYVPLPGGDSAVKHPYRMALAYLWATGVPWDDALPPVAASSATERRILQQQLTCRFNTVDASSMGRLFDAVASLIG